MKLYVIVKTVRKDVKEFPDYFGSNPRRPAICLIDGFTGEACTQVKERAEDTVRIQTEEYGRYFDYTVYELEISNPIEEGGE